MRMQGSIIFVVVLGKYGSVEEPYDNPLLHDLGLVLKVVLFILSLSQLDMFWQVVSNKSIIRNLFVSRKSSGQRLTIDTGERDC